MESRDSATEQLSDLGQAIALLWDSLNFMKGGKDTL